MAIANVANYAKRIEEVSKKQVQIQDSLDELLDQKRSLDSAPVVSLDEYGSVMTLIRITRDDLQRTTSDLNEKKQVHQSEAKTLADIEAKILLLSHQVAEYGLVLDI